MFSRIGKRRRGSAAWRIALWSSLAFAIGTACAFWFLQQILATEIQQRADSWLTGELGVLADVAERTPADKLRGTVVREVAELASREVPRDETSVLSPGAMDRAVFFLQTSATGTLKLQTGTAAGMAAAPVLANRAIAAGHPANLKLPGFPVPFRIAAATLGNGDRIYLALSTEHERHVLRRLRIEFTFLWLTMIVFGTLVVYVSTGRMLQRVEAIAETAETIGRMNLQSRVPAAHTDDEISRLSLTLNRMLDRVESSVQQLHSMSDALAHDLRSPLTSLRAKLEFALRHEDHSDREAAIAQCVEEADRLSSLLATSLDVSEASADALRLRKEPLDLAALSESMVELYEPAFAQAGLTLRLATNSQACIAADSGLVQRTLSNLLDNELKHLPSGRTATLAIEHTGPRVRLSLDDDGPGFPESLLPRIFERHVKGPDSSGFGLGLAFVAAVVRSHDGSASARNRPGGGAEVCLEFPATSPSAERLFSMERQ